MRNREKPWVNSSATSMAVAMAVAAVIGVWRS